MSILNNSLLLGAPAGGGAGYQISRSLRFNSSDSAYLSRTPSSAGNRKTWTWAGWVKRVVIGQSYEYLLDAGVADNFGFTTNSAYVYFGSGALAFKQSSAVFRDPSAWLHYLINFDSTQATAEDRCQIWINGVRLTAWSSNPTIPLNFEGRINSTSTHTMCHALGYSFMSAYLADIHFIDGQALTPSSFGEFDTNNVWQPKAYTGTYGTNGFRLPFSNNASTTTISQDSSGNNNHWTANNISVSAGAGNDSLVDSPTNYGTDTGAGGEVRGNYCTWNPLRSLGSLLNGNLDTSNITTGFEGCTGTVYVSSGKWYWEVAPLAADTATMIGAATNDHPLNSNYSASTTSWTYFMANGQKYGNGANGAAYGAAFASGDIIGVALDMDAGSITFYKNGVSQGVAFNTGIQGKSLTPLMSSFNTTGAKGSANFGQRPFAYTAPSGFKALCTANLPTPTIANGATAMDVKLYTGNGSTQTISGLNFSPDFVWLKNRSAGDYHRLNDVIRGANRHLFSNTTDGEVVNDVNGYLSAFTSDGFSVTSGTGVNASGNAYAAWCWDAGSSTVTNTQGSITSQVRANASAGFSVVTWTGSDTASTIGHGLGVAPGMIIAKSRNNNIGWEIYHASLGKDKPIEFNTNAAVSISNYWGSAEPTSTVFGTRNASGDYNNTGNMVAYCFAPVAGYSNGFSYTGNGSTDGSFVYLGFRPRLILLKCSSTTGNWTLLDTAREGYNVDNDPLYPNLSNAEGTTDLLDITSNGFKLRTTDASVNSSGATYIGYAWAETPFAYSRAR